MLASLRVARVLVAALFALGAVQVPDPAAAFTIRTVALSGETAPGTGGASFASFGTPVLNGVGQVSFTSTLEGVGVDAGNDLALWRGLPVGVDLLARRGGAAAAALLDAAFAPVMNDSGDVAFAASFQAGGSIGPANDSGILVVADDVLDAIALEGDAADGASVGQSYASRLGNPAWSQSGLVAFHGSIHGGGVTTDDNRALWAGTPGSLALIARRGQTAHGVSDGALYASFDDPALHASGTLAYRGRLDSGDAALWAGSSGSPSLVARAGDPAPGTTGDFASFQPPDLGAAGRVAFAGTLEVGTGGVTASNDAGLWVGAPGALALVAREGQTAPGGGTFESFHAPRLDGSGGVVFRARTHVGAGIYRSGPGGLVRIARRGVRAPGTPGATNFTAVRDPVVDEAGRVRFVAFIGGPGTTTANDEVLYAHDGSGVTQLVLREGDAFERRPGDSATIDEFRYLAAPAGRGRAANDFGEGQFTFWMRFADGGEGVFLLPEPGGSLPLAAGVLGLWALSGRRRRARVVSRACAALALSMGLVAGSAGAEPITAPDADRCDFLDQAHCLLPWPSDHFTVADGTSDTGRRLALNVLSMPTNVANVPIQPTDYNRNDGWSPGQMILASLPGIDLEESGAPLITDLERSLHADSATVIVNATTGERHLHWAELDFHATGDATRLLILRPGVNFEEDQRYVVAVRRAVDSDGLPIPPSPVFEAYRDNVPTSVAAVEARRPAMEAVFSALERAGVERSDLVLAWDFTVASERNLSERVLHLRDEAFDELDAAAPDFTVAAITDEFSTNVYRHVQGTYLVPRFVNSPTTGARMTFLDAQGQGPELPDRHLPDQVATFQCIIPRSATASGGDPVTPARPSLLGHGLLGDAGQVTAGHVQAMANEHNFVFCATEWIGMSTPDLAAIFATIIPDLSNFGTIPERGQQSFLNFLYLARLMIHPDGFASDPAFQAGAGLESVIDPSEVYYDGNSQGGIMGGGLMAVAQDITRGVLGVPAMNYSTLLRRSVDFAPFKTVLDQNYTDEIERSLILSLIQILWDRGEANAYAHHITDDPLANTPAHEVLLHEAFGDHQVANVATEVEARTIGAALYTPAPPSGRHTDLYPYDGIPAIEVFPHPGSALIVWDNLPARRPVEPPPVENRPPDEGETNEDPHSDPRNDPDGRAQKAQFLSPASGVIDVCGGSLCYTDGM